MAIRSLSKSEWKAYFDRISKRMPAAYAEISIEGLDLGDQQLTSKSLLDGITYDPASDMLTFFLEGLGHNVNAPREVWVDDGPDGLRSIAVIDSEGHKQIVVFEPLLELPSA